MEAEIKPKRYYVLQIKCFNYWSLGTKLAPTLRVRGIKFHEIPSTGIRDRAVKSPPTTSRVPVVHIPYAAVLSLDGINAGMPPVALLFLLHHMHLLQPFPPTAHGSMQMKKDTTVIPPKYYSRSPSLHSYHSALLLRLGLVVRVIHSDSYNVFHISLQCVWRFITFPFQPLYIPWYSSNETDNG